MFLLIEILDLVLYCAQQAGVMLSVGAETVLLISYVLSMRDGKIDDTEANFIKAMRKILSAGISCIILSGIAIVALHMSTGQADIVFSPVFLFKWLLIIVLTIFFIAGLKKQFLHFAIEGLIGATWYALFFVHIVAPALDWMSLVGIYAVFATLFTAIWAASVHKLKPKAEARENPMIKPVIVAQPAQSKIPPVVPKPVSTPSPIAPVVAKPVPPMQPPAPKPITPVAPVAARSIVPAPTTVPQSTPPKPVAPPAPMAPVAPVVSVPTPKPPAPPPPPAPAAKPEDVHRSLWLPAIHVMPKNEQELNDKSHITPLSRLTKTA